MTTISVLERDLAGSFFRGQIPDTLFLCILSIYILFGMDIATTTMILSLGGFEMNTVMAAVVESPLLHLLLKGCVLIFIAAVAQWADIKVSGSGILMLLVITGWYAFVVMNNTSVLIELCGERCPLPQFF